MSITISELLDLTHTMAGEYLSRFRYPWEALDGIKELILALGSQLSPEEYDQPQEHVWIHKTAVVAPTAFLGAPCIIGPETEVRHCAFIRGSALVGALVVVKGESDIPTGRKKMGAVLGDFVEVGCNSVLNPGTILGRHSSVYPTSCVRGVVPANCIYKDKNHIVPRQER